MQRTELLNKLTTASAGLASNDFIPALSHFWFTGTHLVTYNDQIGVQLPLKTEFKGAVPGAVLLSLLKNTKAKDIELQAQDDTLLVKAASSRFKLGLLGPDSFVWQMPKHTKVVDALPLKEIVTGIKGCLRSVSTDTSIPDQLGISFVPDGGTLLYLFSFNGASISQCEIKLKSKPSFKRSVLPTAFCQQLVSLTSDAKSAQLEITDKYVLLTADDVSLYGSLIDCPQPQPFIEIIGHELPKDADKRWVSIPSKLQLMLERAIIVTENPSDPTTTDVSIADGKMRFFSKSGRGEVTDTVLVDKPQANARLSIDCKHLKNGYGAFDKMIITNSCFIMSKEKSMYLVTAVG